MRQTQVHTGQGEGSAKAEEDLEELQLAQCWKASASSAARPAGSLEKQSSPLQVPEKVWLYLVMTLVRGCLCCSKPPSGGTWLKHPWKPTMSQGKVKT